MQITRPTAAIIAGSPKKDRFQKKTGEGNNIVLSTKTMTPTITMMMMIDNEGTGCVLELLGVVGISRRANQSNVPPAIGMGRFGGGGVIRGCLITLCQEECNEASCVQLIHHDNFRAASIGQTYRRFIRRL